MRAFAAAALLSTVIWAQEDTAAAEGEGEKEEEVSLWGDHYSYKENG